MGFALIPTSVGPNELTPLSTPYGIDVCAESDGLGAQTIYINGMGYDDESAIDPRYDMKTFFGTSFKSYMLQARFKGSADFAALLTPRFFKDVDVSITPLGSSTYDVSPSFTIERGGVSAPGVVIPAGVPLVKITGPTNAGFWRVRIRLRHSIGA